MIQQLVWQAPKVAIRREAAKPSDEALMARVIRRDARALESLYERYAASALGCADRMLNDRAVAEEVVQEAFWRVWKSSETYAHRRGRFCSWFFGIVHNLSIDEIRRRSCRPPLANSYSIGENILQLSDNNCDVTAAAMRRITGESVRRALSSLTEDQRRVVELAYFQGFTHKEIAAKMNQPLGTIHTKARAALLRLKESLTRLQMEELG